MPSVTTGNSAATSGVLELASGSSLTAGGNNSNTFFQGRVAGAGTFTKTGTGTMGLLGNEWNNTGPTIISGGTIQYLSSNVGLSSTSLITVAAGATLDLFSQDDDIGGLAGDGLVKGGVVRLVGGHTATFNGTVTSALEIDNFSAVQTFGGSIGGPTVTRGTLRLGKSNVISDMGSVYLRLVRSI